MFTFLANAIGTILKEVLVPIFNLAFGIILWTFIIAPVLSLIYSIERAVMFLSNEMIIGLMYKGNISKGFDFNLVRPAFWVFLGAAFLVGVLGLILLWFLSMTKEPEQGRKMGIMGTKKFLFSTAAIFGVPLGLILMIIFLNQILNLVNLSIFKTKEKTYIADTLYYIGSPNPPDAITKVDSYWTLPPGLLGYNFIIQVFATAGVLVGLVMIVALIFMKTWDLFIYFLLAPFVFFLNFSDNGERLKNWSKTITAKVMGLALIPVGFTLYHIFITTGTEFFGEQMEKMMTEQGESPGTIYFAQQIFKVIFLLAGLTGLISVSNIVARLIGGEAMGISEALQTGGQFRNLALMGIGGAWATKKFVLGKGNKEGRAWKKQMKAANKAAGLPRGLTSEQQLAYKQKFGWGTRGGLFGMGALAGAGMVKAGKLTRAEIQGTGSVKQGLRNIGYKTKTGIKNWGQSRKDAFFNIGGVNTADAVAKKTAQQKSLAQELFKTENAFFSTNEKQYAGFFNAKKQVGTKKELQAAYKSQLNELTKNNTNGFNNKEIARLQDTYKKAMEISSKKVQLGLVNKDGYYIDGKVKPVVMPDGSKKRIFKTGIENTIENQIGKINKTETKQAKLREQKESGNWKTKDKIKEKWFNAQSKWQKRKLDNFKQTSAKAGSEYNKIKSEKNKK